MDFGYDEKGKRISSTAEDSSGRSTPVSSEEENEGVRQSSLSMPEEGNGERYEEEDSSSNGEELLSDSSSVSHTRNTKKKDKKKRRVHFDEEGDDSASSPSESSTSSFSSSEDTSSSSDSEAEIIVGEEPTQHISEPLVQPAEVFNSAPGSREKGGGRNTFFLTSGPHDEDDTSGQEGGGKKGRDGSGRPLLLTDRPSALDSLASFIDTLASIGGRGGMSSSSSPAVSTSENAPTARSRVRSAVLIGSLHHGKSSFLRLLLSSQKKSSDVTTNSAGDGSSRSQNIAPYSSPLSSEMNIVGYQQSVDEIERAVTIKSHVITTVARGTRIAKTSHLLTLLDTPGHADLFCEATAAMRVSDAAILCVDVVESLLSSGEALLEQAVRIEKIPVLLVLTKLDRLIVELKLPPVDAYRKLRHVVDTVNNAIYRFTREVEKEECDRGHPQTSRTTDTAHAAASPSFLVSPENGTVCFSSAVLGVCFSLETFAHKYAEVYTSIVSPALLSRQLWGQHTFKEKQFQRITSVQQKPSFVQFILEPLYKIVSHAVCGSGSAMEQLGMEEKNGERPLLPRSPLLAVRQAMQYFCGAPGEEGMDILLAALPEPQDRSRWLLDYYQLGQKREDRLSFTCKEKEDTIRTQYDHKSQEGIKTTEDERDRMHSSSSSSNVFAVAPLVRLYKENSVAAVVRVLRGTLQCRDSLVVVDESCGENAPYYTIKVKQLFVLSPDVDALGKDGNDDVHESKRRGGKEGFLPITQARENQVVYMTGLGHRSGSHLVFIGGAAVSSVLTPNQEMEEEEEEEEEELMRWFNAIRPPRYFTPRFPPLIHVDLELKDPQKADFLKDCLQLLQRTTPGVDVHRQETGEFTLHGYGEFHLDVILRELRQVLAPDVRLGVSPPYVSFAETVQEDEGILAMAGARRAAIGCVSGVLSSPELEDVVVRGKLPIELLSSVSSSALTSTTRDSALEWCLLLREKYGLDALDAQHIMAVGPDPLTGPNIFLDDTLEEERHISKDGLSAAHREAIIAGFRAAVAAGPLVGELVRGVRLQLIFADIDPETKPSVVLANARSAARQSLLGARPRLLEPILSCEILCSSGEEGIKIVKSILEQRRGVVLYELPIPATTLTRYQALVPALDSFGLETQIRMATHGQCFPSFRFYHWDVVPGDPFDGTVNVGKLDVAQGHELARDFVMKMRFRKGLSSQLVSGEW